MLKLLDKLNGLFSRKLTVIAILIVLAIPTLLPLTHQGFFPTQDFIHVARLYEMDQSLKGGQFPVRWVPDFRYGEPLFNFYAPLPYYVGTLIHNLGFSFLDTTKILFGLGFVLSGVAMFFFARELFGSLGGFIASALYIYAPYHSVDVYVRGALSESLALVFFPLIFLASLKLSRDSSAKSFIFLSLSLAGLFFTHNIMTVLFFPFYIGWAAYLIWSSKNLKLVKKFVLATVLGLGLAASFLLPAFFEKDFVRSTELISGYFDYRGHFVEVRQFFTPSWGYGASLWGAKDDGMSFQVGLTHWFALALSLILTLVFRKSRVVLSLTLFLIAEFLFSLFMQHNKSTPIWLTFPTLAFTQFPWRFLGISIFLISIVGGAMGLYLKKWAAIFGVLLALGVVVFNIGYFHPESFYLDSIDDHYASAAVFAIDDKLPKDYLPVWVTSLKEEKVSLPHTMDGEAEVSNFNKRSSSATFKIKVLKKADVEIPVTYFPGWEVLVNDKLVSQEEPSKRGLIRVRLAEGDYKIKLNFSNTPVRSLGNITTLLSALVVVAFATGKLRLGKWLT